MTERPEHAAFAYLGAFVDELYRAGVRHVCAAPGSRSAPLALAVAQHPEMRIWMHVDERSAAFFALGMARMLGAPVALVCTSGTAAANFLPAIAEARNSGVPLVVLTADRPHELRDVAAAQTIDQNRLFGVHVKWFVEMAIPESTSELLRYSRTMAARAVATAAASPAGPVHLNFPLREPLVPEPALPPMAMTEADAAAWLGRNGGEPWVRVVESALAPPPHETARVAALLQSAERPLVVCGQQHDPGLAESLTSLAATLHAPVLADPLSQLRWGPHDHAVVIDCYDSFLRHAGTAATLAPDLIIRFGAPPTSKVLTQFLQQQAAAPLVVVDHARWPDPTHSAAHMVHADPTLLCQALAALCNTGQGAAGDREGWLAAWRDADDRAAAAIDAHNAALEEMFEGRVLADIAAMVPDGGTVFVSSSMPVRDLDAFGRGDARTIRVLSNRGANGIDGVLSTALGAAAAAPDAGCAPLVLVIGDLAMQHDIGGLLAAHLHGIDATVVVINNDGGGVFSFLPQADHPEYFEKLFGTPHGLHFRHAAAHHGAEYVEASDFSTLQAAVAAGIAGSGLHVVEVRTERARNVELHQAVLERVTAALVEAPLGAR